MYYVDDRNVRISRVPCVSQNIPVLATTKLIVLMNASRSVSCVAQNMYFFPSLVQSAEKMARMAAGDELKLTLDPVGQRAHGKSWEGLGQVLRIADCEVSLMMHGGNVPLDITDGYQVIFLVLTLNIDLTTQTCFLLIDIRSNLNLQFLPRQVFSSIFNVSSGII